MTKQSNDKQQSKRRKGYDILPKIFCLLAAFILWLYVTQVETSDYQETFNGISVELINSSVLENETGLHVYSGYGNTVNVTVSGKKSDIDKYTADDIRVTADIADIKEGGKHSVSISVDVPSELKVSDTSVSSINVYVDESSSLELDIRPRITKVTVDNGYELGEPVPEHAFVTVTGPKNIISKISHAEIPLDLGTVSSSVSTIGKLSLIPTDKKEEIDMRYVQLSFDEVKVSVPILTTKSVPLGVTYKYGYYNNDNVKITFDPETVVIKGDPQILEKLTKVSLGEIDEKSITTDSMLVRNLILPAGCSSADNIETVNVNIKHIGTVVRTFPINNIKITGAGKNSVDVLTGVVTVRLRGPKATLDKISTDDISVTVNLSDFSDAVTGTVTVNATITVNGAYKNVYPVGDDYQVQIKIS